MFEKNMSVEDIATKCNIEKEDVERILKLNKNSEHKRKEASRVT